ncbi:MULTISPECIES: CcoQ/FixQ family Cbb3-type cytochrome c oxidase assembly chaperone [Vibrio]|uniref:CcoQ/FixQ family Cbb3-type cytochrome c oxidase assembly chaperone n=1 Tax=Vibrio aestuarianus TaxID=28171 RepID=A0A7X6N9Z4_9VIBR|nr:MULTISPECIES: CcoQ/FixQ family Cbb3-type cytochrome c oxidase assembly chaperone [Vibrio]KOE80818.1 cytochrome C oxidase [Vibrio alginolyticus]MDE1209147.1 CcoQ/FixQ family Cbb3-type cytochrome c oxidase assembly chaperone [Vibrio aestuarianus]MDE1212514.1 CcoQ/FixQ family Cbb3-type cytochrome c oxidase assembly chaperone [Vibrio aestuarianus]MDE1216923.1 CcoQ/FixQ family Cbb3-type cytochrome c oxidase assembly chaperone [Vibrio aestuarianus]MDE1221761.1 CcoQ/FixQ family Cbb3-type cytochrom
MDIGTIHSIWTIVLFVCFIGVVWWAYGKNRKARFDEDANLIFADEPPKTSKEQGVTK